MGLPYHSRFHRELANLCKRLRYILGGDRPSQTTHQILSTGRIHGTELDVQMLEGGISYCDSMAAGATTSESPTYSKHKNPYTNTKL